MKWNESCSVVSNSLWPHGLYNSRNSPGQNTGVGSLSLLHKIFPTQESNRGLLHCKQILYQLSYEGSPKVHIKEMISMSPGSCIFPYIETLLISLTWDIWPPLIKSNLSMFQLSGFYWKTPVYSGSSFMSSEKSLRTIWEAASGLEVLRNFVD